MYEIFILRFPFNWQNPIGFVMAFILFYIIHINLTIAATFGFCYGICFYMLMTALTDDVENDSIAISARVKMEPNSVFLCQQLFDFIEFHSTVKRYKRSKININQSINTFPFKTIQFHFRFFCDLVKISQFIFMVTFVANIITLCVAMLSIQIEMVSQIKSLDRLSRKILMPIIHSR